MVTFGALLRNMPMRVYFKIYVTVLSALAVFSARRISDIPEHEAFTPLQAMFMPDMSGHESCTLDRTESDYEKVMYLIMMTRSRAISPQYATCQPDFKYTAACNVLHLDRTDTENTGIIPANTHDGLHATFPLPTEYYVFALEKIVV